MRLAYIGLSIQGQWLLMLFFLLITIITSQAFQISANARRISNAHTADKQLINDQQQQDQHTSDRWKREAAVADTTERSQFIDAVFNIPIKTLMAVNNIVQKSRPVFRRIGEFAAKRFEEAIRPLNKQNGRTEIAPNPSYIVPADDAQNAPVATAAVNP